MEDKSLTTDKVNPFKASGTSLFYETFMFLWESCNERSALITRERLSPHAQVGESRVLPSIRRQLSSPMRRIRGSHPAWPPST